MKKLCSSCNPNKATAESSLNWVVLKSQIQIQVDQQAEYQTAPALILPPLLRIRGSFLQRMAISALPRVHRYHSNFLMQKRLEFVCFWSPNCAQAHSTTHPTSLQAPTRAVQAVRPAGGSTHPREGQAACNIWPSTCSSRHVCEFIVRDLHGTLVICTQKAAVERW